MDQFILSQNSAVLLLMPQASEDTPVASHHEHFAVTPESLHLLVPSPTPVPVEFLETFFDTPDFKLLGQNIWLRCRETLRGHDINCNWTLKKRGTIVASTENVGPGNVMEVLAALLGKVDHPKSPMDFCPKPFAVIRTRRYAVIGKPLWIDVCLFEKGDVYVLGGIEAADTTLREALKANFDAITPVQSKICAYLTKYGKMLQCPELTASVTGQSRPFMFLKEDPFGGEFAPLQMTDADPLEEVSDGGEDEGEFKGLQGIAWDA